MFKTEIIAEAGLNHNGKIKNALKLIDIAKKANINLVKFQLFRTSNFINNIVQILKPAMRLQDLLFIAKRAGSGI